MNIVFKYKDPAALDKYEHVSPKRELFIESQELVELTFEMHQPEAWQLFNALPGHVLPPLPQGHHWVRANNNYSVIRNSRAQEHELTLVLYGPDKSNYINFICCVDGVTTYSFGHTKKGKGPDRKFPMRGADYRVPGYDYTNKKYKAHVRGHLIDHQDTIRQNQNSSTYDRRNYVPEPPQYEWGLGFRNQKVAALRNHQHCGAYAQMNVYPETPLQTADGTNVPEDVRFFAYDKGNGYVAKEVYHVEFEEEMTRPKGKKVLEHAKERFLSSLESSPVVVPYAPELTDRALRHQGRTAAIKEKNILAQKIYSRFQEKDSLFSAYTAGDREFESAGRQLHAGIATKEVNQLSNSYLNRSRFFATQLADLDEIPPYTKIEALEWQRYAKDKREVIDDETVDHLNKLLADFKM